MTNILYFFYKTMQSYLDFEVLEDILRFDILRAMTIRNSDLDNG